jgi:Protein of unknown function (DUF1549)/Protein of unknown function (DUF1553)
MKWLCDVATARRRLALALLTWAGVLFVVPARAQPPAAEAKKPHFPRPAKSEGVPLIPPGWSTVPVEPLTPGELDRLLAAAQEPEYVEREPAASDEEFVRRVHLDLVGTLPPVGTVEAFIALKESNKRATLIDELLEDDDFARVQAQYWRDVIQARATDPRDFVAYPRTVSLEKWLYDQFRARRSWAAITHDLLMAEGEYKLSDPTQGGALGFLMNHTFDTEIARANDTARVFLGMKIACAQCHDAPEHVWKRQQFHELAAFFGRLSYKVNVNAKNNLNFITTLVVKEKGEYLTPDAYDAKVTTPTPPRFFLTGQSLPADAGDRERRQVLADCVTSGENYYFAAALVNRVWGRLLGQSFTRSVEDLGPIQEVTYPEVLLRLAASVRATGFDIRALYRVVMNSQVYQRGFRQPERIDQHLHFGACCPTPIRPDELWSELTSILGPTNGAQFLGRNSTLNHVPPLSLKALFDQTFTFDPALAAHDVEATVPQALFLMNNPMLQANIQATGDTVLAETLTEFANDKGAVSALYLRALGRHPSPRELQTCLAYIQEVGDRGKAFEDLQWVLINSTEFRIRH